MKYILLGLLLLTSSFAFGKDCKPQVQKVFASVVSIQESSSVESEHVYISELTKYQWSILVSNQNVAREYLAIVHTDNCRVESFIEANGEVPTFDYHWEK